MDRSDNRLADVAGRARRADERDKLAAEREAAADERDAEADRRDVSSPTCHSRLLASCTSCDHTGLGDRRGERHPDDT